MGPQILENVERVLKEDGASAVTVNIVWDPLWTPDAMTDALKRELGILPPEDALEVEPQLEIDLPPPAVKKKKGLLGWILGS
jgi:metal-sulfur cluster biosynthetic enzyme